MFMRARIHLVWRVVVSELSDLSEVDSQKGIE
jgi:hypothetical protein